MENEKKEQEETKETKEETKKETEETEETKVETEKTEKEIEEESVEIIIDGFSMLMPIDKETKEFACSLVKTLKDANTTTSIPNVFCAKTCHKDCEIDNGIVKAIKESIDKRRTPMNITFSAGISKLIEIMAALEDKTEEETMLLAIRYYASQEKFVKYLCVHDKAQRKSNVKKMIIK